MMHWKELLCEKRAGVYTSPTAGQRKDLRSEFEKDYHRIIGSSTFRRLQDKTQVFALDKSDFIRTRLTHSLEVSSFAKSLGQSVSQQLMEQQLDPEFSYRMQSDICDILQCAGLIHDIGNPPFGHFGEEAIRDWFRRKLPELYWEKRPLTEVLTKQMQGDLCHFEGNAQALRQVSRLHFLVNEYGMNLTYGLLNTIIKYPVSSLEIETSSGRLSRKKMGYFHAEEELFRDIVQSTGAGDHRHPLTFLLEAADDIAYKTADIEDSFKKGFLTYSVLKKELEKAEKNCESVKLDAVAILEHQYENGWKRRASDPELYAVQNFIVRLQSRLLFCASESFLAHYEEIMNGTLEQDLFFGTEAQWIMEALGKIAWKYAFDSAQILQMEVTAGGILENLMNRFVPAALYYDTDQELSMMDLRLMKLISSNYRQVYHIYSGKTSDPVEKLYLRLLLVTDFVSGMTDSYARDLYQQLMGMR